MQTLVLLALAISLVYCQPWQRKSYLKCGERLAANQFIESTNGYYAIMQDDCNLVIYRSFHFVSRNALWSSKTVNQKCQNPRLQNQLDGNVVIYSAKNPIFSTATQSKQKCYSLVMQDDGNLVLYTQDSQAVWSSGTAA